MNVAAWTNRRNPLVYPAGRNPGFDPTHPAAASIKCGGSFVPAGGNLVNLLNGASCIASTTLPTQAVLGPIGPCLNFNANVGCQPVGPNISITPSSWTIAAICQLISYTTGNHMVASQTGLGRSLKAASGAGGWEWNNSGSGLLGITPVINVPLFIAASGGNSGTVNMVQLNLKTGIITKGTASASSYSSGQMFIGNISLTGGDQLLGYIAAVMFSESLVLLQELLAWAADPWSFWYPRDRFAGGF